MINYWSAEFITVSTKTGYSFSPWKTVAHPILSILVGYGSFPAFTLQWEMLSDDMLAAGPLACCEQCYSSMVQVFFFICLYGKASATFSWLDV